MRERVWAMSFVERAKVPINPYGIPIAREKSMSNYEALRLC